MSDLPPTKIKIMADWGPSYAWDERGFCTVIADYFPNHPQIEKLKTLESELENWAWSLYEGNDEQDNFSIEQFDQIGFSLARELAVLLSENGVRITFVLEVELRKKGRTAWDVEIDV